MNDLEFRLEAEYESALEAEAPPCRVDMDLARANGRALRRRRRTAMTGSSLAVAALAVLIVVGLLPGVGFGRGPIRTATGAGDYSGESVPPAYDPLATRIGFGWLPDGVSVAGVTTQSPDIGDVTAGGAGMRFTASVLVGKQSAALCSTSRTDPVPSLTMSGSVVHVTGPACEPPAPQVNGRPAYWVIGPDDPGTNLGGVQFRWQYADGAWAELNALLPANMDTATVTALVHKVAQNIHVSRFQAVPMPFRLGNVPAGWEFEFAAWVGGPQGRQVGAPEGGLYGASVSLGLGTGEVRVWAGPAAAGFPTAAELKSIAAAPSAQSQNLTVDGHQARILTDSDHKALMVHGVNGLDVTVEAIDPAALALVESAGGIVGYFHTVTVFSADRATWTTRVLG